MFYAINVAVVFLAFLPFLSWDSLWNYGASLRLWFQDFEFNASLWYIIRWIGFQMEGYNTLVYVGPVMAMTAAVVILGIGLIRKNATLKEVMTSMLFSLSVYFFLSSTVHPWYLCTLVFLSIFTRYRFPIVWSLMVFLSYGAYSRAGHEENLWLIAAANLFPDRGKHFHPLARNDSTFCAHIPSMYANISGATMVASLSTMNFGVLISSLPQVIFSFGTAPE